MLPGSWKPVAAAGLIRLGPKGDGGYVVGERSVRASTLLLSMGLNDDWRFEAAFRRMSGARVVCFDHSVTWRFWVIHALKDLARLRLFRLFHYFAYRWFFRGEGAEHRRLKIGYDGPGGTGLAALLDEAEGDGDAIFLKVDIEGSEYRILPDIVANAHRFTGIVMELHDIDLHHDRVATFLAGLRGFTIVCLHPNNYAGVDDAGDPLVIEISLIRDDLVDPPAGAATLPAPQPNDPRQPEIELHFAA